MQSIGEQSPPSSFYQQRKLVSLAEVCLSISAPAHRGQDLQPNSGGARRHTDEGLTLDQLGLTNPSSSCQLCGGGGGGTEVLYTYTVHGV